MKRYLAALIMLGSMPVFGAGGWTLLGSPLNKQLGNDTGIICGEAPSFSSGWGEDMLLRTNCLYSDANALPSGNVELWWTVVTNCPTIQHNPIDMIYTTYWSPLTSPGLWTALGSVTNNFIETNWLSTRVASDYTWLTNGYYTTTALETNYVSGTSAIWQYTTNCIGCQTVSTNSGTLSWMKTTDSNTVLTVATSIASDKGGNVYAGGYYYPGTTIGTSLGYWGSAVTNGGYYDGFIVKYSRTGSVVWSKNIGSSGDDEVFGLCVDSQTNLIAVGQFGHTVTNFDGYTGTNLNSHWTVDSPNDVDIWVAKWTSVGQLLWVRTFGSGANDLYPSVCVDTNDDVFLTFQGGTPIGFPIDFGYGLTLTGHGGWDVTIIKVASATGLPIWGQMYGGTMSDYAKSIACDRNGDVFVCGVFGGGTGNLGGAPLSNDGNGAFVASYFGSTGAFRWSRLLGGLAAQSIAANQSAVVSGSETNIIVGGYNGSALFLNAYSSAGAYYWNQQYVGGSSAAVFNAAIDSNGAIAATGFLGTQSWPVPGGGYQVDNSAGFGVVVLNAGGDYQWHYITSRPGVSQGNAAVFDPFGHICFAGKVEAGYVVFFNSSTFVTSGNVQNMFVGEYIK